MAMDFARRTPKRVRPRRGGHRVRRRTARAARERTREPSSRAPRSRSRRSWPRRSRSGAWSSRGCRLRARSFAGHSLGEYSALVAAGALPLGDAVRLVRRRGALMQEAVPEGEGAMAAVLGLEPAEVARICAEVDGVVSPANFNSPVQTVIAGRRNAVSEACERMTAAGAKRVIALDVSAPFHCALMTPAMEKLTPELEAARFRDLRDAGDLERRRAPYTSGRGGAATVARAGLRAGALGRLRATARDVGREARARGRTGQGAFGTRGEDRPLARPRQRREARRSRRRHCARRGGLRMSDAALSRDRSRS